MKARSFPINLEFRILLIGLRVLNNYPWVSVPDMLILKKIERKTDLLHFLLFLLQVGVGRGQVLLGLVQIILSLHHLLLGISEFFLKAHGMVIDAENGTDEFSAEVHWLNF